MPRSPWWPVQAQLNAASCRRLMETRRASPRTQEVPRQAELHSAVPPCPQQLAHSHQSAMMQHGVLQSALKPCHQVSGTLARLRAKLGRASACPAALAALQPKHRGSDNCSVMHAVPQCHITQSPYQSLVQASAPGRNVVHRAAAGWQRSNSCDIQRDARSVA